MLLASDFRHTGNHNLYIYNIVSRDGNHFSCFEKIYTEDNTLLNGNFSVLILILIALRIHQRRFRRKNPIRISAKSSSTRRIKYLAENGTTIGNHDKLTVE